MNAEAVRVAALVQGALKTSNPHAARVRVIADEVGQHPEGIWYVPVSVQRDTEFMSLIYQSFSDIEDRLESQHGLRTLIVPRIMPYQKSQDAA